MIATRAVVAATVRPLLILLLAAVLAGRCSSEGLPAVFLINSSFVGLPTAVAPNAHYSSGLRIVGSGGGGAASSTVVWNATALADSALGAAVTGGRRQDV